MSLNNSHVKTNSDFKENENNDIINFENETENENEKKTNDIM